MCVLVDYRLAWVITVQAEGLCVSVRTSNSNIIITVTITAKGQSPSNRVLHVTLALAFSLNELSIDLVV